MAPRDDDARKIWRDMEGFLPTAINTFLGLDYSKLSHTSLILHHRTRNWLSKAEDELIGGNYVESIKSSAGAVRLFMVHRKLDNRRFRKVRNLSIDELFNNRESNRLLRRFAERLQEEFNVIHHQLGLVNSGISYNEYIRFNDIAPALDMMGDGRIHFYQKRDEKPLGYEEALFCVNFSRKLVLKIQSQYQRDPFERREQPRRFITTKPVNVIVYPTAQNTEAEVIQLIDNGTDLMAYGAGNFDKPGFVAIYYQGDLAYVDSTCVMQRE